MLELKKPQSPKTSSNTKMDVANMASTNPFLNPKTPIKQLFKGQRLEMKAPKGQNFKWPPSPWENPKTPWESPKTSWENPKTPIKNIFKGAPNPFLHPEYANQQKAYFTQITACPIANIQTSSIFFKVIQPISTVSLSNQSELLLSTQISSKQLDPHTSTQSHSIHPQSAMPLTCHSIQSDPSIFIQSPSNQSQSAIFQLSTSRLSRASNSLYSKKFLPPQISQLSDIQKSVITSCKFESDYEIYMSNYGKIYLALLVFMIINSDHKFKSRIITLYRLFNFCCIHDEGGTFAIQTIPNYIVIHVSVSYSAKSHYL